MAHGVAAETARGPRPPGPSGARLRGQRTELAHHAELVVLVPMLGHLVTTAAGERGAGVLGDAHPGSSKATPRSAHT